MAENPSAQDNTGQEASSVEAQGKPEKSPVAQIVHKYIAEGIQARASDIFFEPLEEELLIRYRVDGKLHKVGTLPLAYHEPIVIHTKVVSSLDIAEHRLPQDGRFKMTMVEKEVDFRVSIVPTNSGEKIVLRVLDKSSVILDVNRLGFDERSLGLFKKNLVKPFGMILVCGPTGSGKTTTLYSCLKYIDSVEKNIVSVEDPIEYQLYGINQVEVHEDIGMTFAAALRAILRQDPNIVLVGEIRDHETADIAVKAALTGHLIISTLHTISAVGSIIRLMNMEIEPFLVASCCLLVASQVLVRVLCPECKEPYHPSDALIQEFAAYGVAITREIVLYKHKGCERCNTMGFKGRVALVETAEINFNMKEAIIRGASQQELKDIAIKDGMISLRHNGFELIAKGMTTVEEIIRTTSAD